MAETIITGLLIFSCCFLLANSLVLFRNRFELTPLPVDKPLEAPSISILIPARNEQQNIESSIRKACDQEYSKFEVIVLDDHSTDRTPAILTRLGNEFPGLLQTIVGRKKPDDWLGKPWACRQLAGAARGDYLLFIDADVLLGPHALQRITAAFEKQKLDMLTVWPLQILKTFWEQTLIPLVYYAMTTLLPSIYVYRKPHWMPGFLQKYTCRLFAAACGQCIAFRKGVYEQLGGHEVVKNKVVEDVALARVLRCHGHTMRMFEGSGTAECRMYRNAAEIREGFRKNLFAGFGYSYSLFLSVCLLHLVVYILPFAALPLALPDGYPAWILLSSLSISFILLQRMIISVWFGWNPAYALTHPLGVLWFQKLALLTIIDKVTGRYVYWKGRPV